MFAAVSKGASLVCVEKDIAVNKNLNTFRSNAEKVSALLLTEDFQRSSQIKKDLRKPRRGLEN
jgi:hypothetical protein